MLTKLHKPTLLVLGLASLGLFLSGTKPALASNPSTINFQGKVVNADGTNVSNGTYSFIFRIYNTSSPVTTTSCTSTASCLWEETQSSVSVTNGVFQVELGSSCALTSASCNNSAGGPISWSSTSSLYLTMQFNGDSAGFMSPTIHITSVPFALQADNSSTLGGIAASGFIQNNSGSAQSSSNFHISGTGVADTQLQSPLFDTATSAGSLGIGTSNAGTITQGNVTNSTFIFQNKSSSTAFQVQNSNNRSLLTIDTQNNVIDVGNATDGSSITLAATGNANATIRKSTTVTSAVNAHDAVMFDSSNAGQVTQDNSTSGTIFGVATTTNGSSTVQDIVTSGIYQVNLSTTSAAVAIGDDLLAAGASDAGKVIDGGACDSTNQMVGRALETKTAGVGGIIWALISPSSGNTGKGSHGACSIPTPVTLQSAYNNSTGGTTPEILLQGGDNTGVDIQNSNSSPVTGSLFAIRNGTASGLGTAMFSIDNNGLITLQPAASLTSGQTETAQTFTNGSSTGGIVNGYSQTITVSNTASASTTNGIKISLSDATSLANIDTGLSVDLSGVTNSSATKVAANFNGGSVVQTTNGPVYLGGNDITSTNGSGTGNETFNDVFVAGNYAYAVKAGDATTCAGSSGSFIGCELQIYDISQPSRPRYMGGADSTGATNSGTGNISFNAVYVSGRYAYVVQNPDSTACAQTAPNGCEVKVFDISNPSAPTYIGGADDSGTTNTGSDGLQALVSVFVSGRYLYTGGNDGGGGGCGGHIMNCQIKIWDISNPSAPHYLSSASDDGTTNGGSSSATGTTNSIYVSGRYMYTGSSANGILQNCTSTAGNAPGCELKVWDISNPSSPSYLGGANDSGNTNSGTNTNGDGIESVFVSGRYAYTASAGFTTACASAAGSGIGCELKAWDISTPGSPTYVGGADSSGSTNTGSIADTFNSVYVTGHYAYVTQVGDSSSACSSTAGSAKGCEIKVFDISTPGSPTYFGGADVAGLTNSGSNSVNVNSVFVAGRYIYTVTGGNATACSNTPGSAIGCEFQVYDSVGVDTTSLSTGTLQAGVIQVQNSGVFDDQLSVYGALTVGQSLQVSGNIGTSGTVLLQNQSNSTAAFQVQNASGSSVITADTLNGQVLLGTNSTLAGKLVFNSSSTGSVAIVAGSTSTTLVLTLPTAAAGSNNQCIVSSTGGTLSFLPCGAGSTAKVVLAPEFVGAVMTPVSLTGWTNSGTMTSDFCSGSSRQNINTLICTSSTESHNYYAWTASTNCVNYDLWVRWSVPNDFASFPSSNNNFNAWKTGNSTTCNSVSGSDDVKVNVYTDGSASSCASQSMTNTSGSWQNTAINMSGCTPNPGDVLTFDVQLKVNTSGDFARIGEIALDYNRN